MVGLYPASARGLPPTEDFGEINRCRGGAGGGRRAGKPWRRRRFKMAVAPSQVGAGRHLRVPVRLLEGQHGGDTGVGAPEDSGPFVPGPAPKGGREDRSQLRPAGSVTT